MAPMAMAIPPRDMMSALIPCFCMMMKAMSTPIGREMIATSEERRCQRNTAQTKATTMNSSSSLWLRFVTARSINRLRS
ncbi:hypothetical protein D9M70_654340 [compost metagenome]